MTVIPTDRCSFFLPARRDICRVFIRITEKSPLEIISRLAWPGDPAMERQERLKYTITTVSDMDCFPGRKVQGVFQ